jgi:hypothetical protein
MMKKINREVSKDTERHGHVRKFDEVPPNKFTAKSDFIEHFLQEERRLSLR